MSIQSGATFTIDQASSVADAPWFHPSTPALAMFFSLLALSLLPQANVSPVILKPADRVLPVEFTQVRAVRELPDGRVLITDRLDEKIVVADFRSGQVRTIGRPGAGPQEYHLPSGLVPMPGDSTLFVDEGNGRLGIIGPDLTIRRTFVLRVPNIAAELAPRGFDSRGRAYAQVPRWAMSTETNPADTVPVLRIEGFGARVETVAWVRALGRGPSYSSGPRIPYVPFSSSDTWMVLPDGRLSVFRASDYHVDLIASDGRVSAGPRVRWSQLPVTDADRVDYTRRFLANSGSAGRAGAGGPGTGMTATPAEMMTPKAIRAMIGQSEFATSKPPFTDALPRLGPDNTIWLQRSAPLGADPTFDGFNSEGRLVRQIVLPAGRRLVGVGRTTFYAVVADEDGIERVEAYRRPQ